mmetsp:Transcript_25546/g.55957  ORF Transcript_25546/g.55957 Transcript_25546/m.55957 type:complete len:601 (+) Transcript_25546:242-2044(+)
MWSTLSSSIYRVLGREEHPADEQAHIGSSEDLQTALLPPSSPVLASDNNQYDGMTAKRWYQNPQQITAMISNFSTSYNVVNISLVLPILKELHSGGSDRDTAVVASSLLAGMIFGQLVGGALGDSWLGRMGALRLVMALQIVASLASAFVGIGRFVSHGSEDIYLWLTGWRFVLGIGCGGVYPLAAVISAEDGTRSQQRGSGGENRTQVDATDSSRTNNNQERKGTESSSVQRVVLTFSMQGIGFVCVPLVAVLLLFCTSNLNLVWRTMLGLGALPGVVLIFIQCHHHRRDRQTNEPFPEIERTEDVASDGELENDSDLTSMVNNISDDSEQISAVEPTESEPTPNNESSSSVNNGGGWLQTLLHEPGLGRKVIGTAGTWFLFDVVFYGNTIFQPIVVAAAFGTQGGNTGTSIQLLRKTAIDSLILTSIALPGYAMAGIIMGKKTFCVRQTPRYVMLQGFAAMTILYATIGFNWSYLRGDPTMLVFLYGMTFFFANYGPNTTTFILPSLVFEIEHRATWNGVSAAAGKLGALTGATMFAPAADELGDDIVMLLCAGIAFFAFLLTYCAVPEQKEPEQVSATRNNSDFLASLNSTIANEVV